MSIADNFQPYPASASEESWKAAKTESLRDQWNTELGQSLRVAQRLYYQIKPDKIDVARLKKAKGEFQTMAAFDRARREAETHYHTILLPALAALQKAREKASAASKNVVISKSSKTKAAEIVRTLDPYIRVLKAAHLDDFTAERERLVEKFHGPH